MERAICVVRVRATAVYLADSPRSTKNVQLQLTLMLSVTVSSSLLSLLSCTKWRRSWWRTPNTEDRTTKCYKYSEFVGHRKVFPEEWYVYSVLRQFEVCCLCGAGSQAQIRLIVDIFVHCSVFNVQCWEQRIANTWNCVQFTPLPILARVR